jgi:C-8 sterol isomerase
MVPYIFDPEVVDECALKCIGYPKPEMFDVFAKAMEEHYPGRIENSLPWIYSIAGGAMIQMKLYFASLHEYIMIWGTPIGSEGHSGRHHVAFWDTVIDGETWYFAEGQFEKRIYKPGDRIFVGRRQAVGMNFTDGVWAVEYARGFIPRSLPFGISDEILSTRDFLAVKQTLAYYGSLIGRHWAAPYNKDYPLLIPFKKVVGPIMRASGKRSLKRLVPPPPKELPRKVPFKLAANGRGPAQTRAAASTRAAAKGGAKGAAKAPPKGGSAKRPAAKKG